MEAPKLHYFKLRKSDLSYPLSGLDKGDIICAVKQADNFVVGLDHGKATFSTDEILKIAEEVSEAEYEDYLEYLHSDKTSTFIDQTRESVAGILGDHAAENTETALATTGKFSQLRNKVLGLSKSAGAIKGVIKKHSELLKQRASTIQIQLDAQRALMEAQMDGMRKQMQVMEHALHMANLYLGTGERVIPIRAGVKASENTPITIRQRVLYMEEECAMLDNSSFDYSRLQDFDKYIQDPEFLQLILPEEKGVVVLKVTRKPMKYDGMDPLTQAVLNAENAKCYWLIKNGESLWRFWNDLDIPSKLFPNVVQEVSIHKPGSKEYYGEMQTSAGERLIYMKIGLLLQGIIDRTMVFAPFKDRIRPALTDPSTWEDKVEFLYDDQMNLGEGKTPFPEWLRKVNGTLRPGQRIVTGYLPYGNQVPECAEGYRRNELRTVEHAKRGFYFNFTRTDSYTKKRGTYYLTKECTWINFDAAPVEDFAFYFRSREARIHAREMIPLLKQCLELKEVEAEQEAPFINLLKVKLIEQYGIEQEQQISEQLPNLILWWKGKQRNFRPLVGDDIFNAKAFSAIITQYGSLKGKVTAQELPILNEASTVLAFQRNEKTTIVYSQANDFDRVFFHQTIFVKSKKGWIESQFNKWQIIPPEAKVHPFTLVSKKDILDNIPGDLSKQISPQVIEDTKNKSLEELGLSNNEYLSPLAIVYSINKQRNDHTISIIVDRRGRITSQDLKYKKGQFEIIPDYQGGGIFSDVLKHLPNINAGDVLDLGHTLVTFGSIGKVNIQKALHKQKVKENAEDLAQQKREFLHTNVSRLHQYHHEAWKQGELASYLHEGGDITLFEDHLKTIITPSFKTDLLRFILRELLFYSEGWTMEKLIDTPLAQLKEVALKNYEEREKSFGEDRPDLDQIRAQVISSEFVLHPVKKKDQ